MSDCKACNKLNTLEKFNGDYKKYDDFLYNQIYLEKLTKTKLTFNNIEIYFKKYPIECGREQAYFHLTTKAAGKEIPLSERNPDLRRCERLHWVRPSIESNHLELCGLPCFVYYTEEYNNKLRIHLFNEKERYLIILEERTKDEKKYFLLITAFYIHEDYYLKNVIKRKNKNPKYEF